SCCASRCSRGPSPPATSTTSSPRVPPARPAPPRWCASRPPRTACSPGSATGASADTGPGRHSPMPDPSVLIDHLTAEPSYAGQLLHVERVAARKARRVGLPEDLPALVRGRLEARG